MGKRRFFNPGLLDRQVSVDTGREGYSHLSRTHWTAEDGLFWHANRYLPPMPTSRNWESTTFARSRAL